jgi:hypothetical protein
MVFYSSQADKDLDDILFGLLGWNKVVLTREHCLSYVAEIIEVCDSLDKSNYHSKCTFEIHKKFGNFVSIYRRNKNTKWYLIYNTDQFNNIYIQHIISNHITTEMF